MYEINVRAIVAFREIGRRLEAIKLFSLCMNMNSISDLTCRNINKQLCKAYEVAANNSMKRAADEVVSSFPTRQSVIPLTRAKIDGAWQKHGRLSANGVLRVTIGSKCGNTQNIVTGKTIMLVL